MAITRIGASGVEATSITIPGTYQNGDLIVIFAFRAAITSPSLPAGWTSLTSNSGNASSARLGYKIAGSNSETSGTWTNATGLVCHVYRGVSTSQTPAVFGTSSTNSGSAT